MKFLLFYLCLAVIPFSLGKTFEAYAWSVSQAETRGNPLEVGGFGERTQYQFMEFVWVDYSNVPFKEAAGNPKEVERVFRVYTRDNARMLERNGITPTVYNLYLAHNAGIGRVIERRAPSVSHERAERVQALYKLRFVELSRKK